MTSWKFKFKWFKYRRFTQEFLMCVFNHLKIKISDRYYFSIIDHADTQWKLKLKEGLQIDIFVVDKI